MRCLSNRLRVVSVRCRKVFCPAMECRKIEKLIYNMGVFIKLGLFSEVFIHEILPRKVNFGGIDVGGFAYVCSCCGLRLQVGQRHYGDAALLSN